jgi:hypothetical protein
MLQSPAITTLEQEILFDQRAAKYHASQAGLFRDKVNHKREALRALLACHSFSAATTEPTVVFQQASSCSSDCCSPEAKPETDSDRVVETVHIEVDDSHARKHLARFATDFIKALKAMSDLDKPES